MRSLVVSRNGVNEAVVIDESETALKMVAEALSGESFMGMWRDYGYKVAVVDKEGRRTYEIFQSRPIPKV